MRKLEACDKLTVIALIVIVVCLYAKEVEQKKGKVTYGMQRVQSATEHATPTAPATSSGGKDKPAGTNTEHVVKWRLREVRFPLP